MASVETCLQENGDCSDIEAGKRMRVVDDDDDEHSLPDGCSTFEEVAAAHSLKFEKAFLTLSFMFAAAVTIMRVVSPISIQPSPAKVSLSILNVAVRVAALFARRWRRFPVSKAAAFCMLVNIASLSVATSLWLENKSLRSNFQTAMELFYSNISPEALRTLQMQLRQVSREDFGETSAVFEQYRPHGLAELREQVTWKLLWLCYTYASLLTTYAFITWYSVAFLMLLRHAVPAIALSLIVHFAIVAGRSTEKPMCVFFMHAPLMLMPAIAACVGKMISEGFQRKAFALMEVRRRQAVQEKVLRFKAEFEQDRLKQQHIPNAADVAGKSEVSAWSLCFSAIGKGPPSVHSAPPCLQYAGVGSLAKPGQCLHPDALVWPLGSSVPKKVLEVEAGQSVLCYDNVSGSVSHAEVSECQHLGGDVPWVSVTLIDGTSMTLTAEHPVQPLPSIADGHFSPLQNNLGAIVKAADLQPGKDSLPVLRLLPTAVQKVEDVPCSASATGTTRVALSVQQPLRHSIFVAEPRSHPELQARVAVSSANLQTQEARGDEQLSVHRTFLQWSTKMPNLKRCNSAPPGGCLDSLRCLHAEDQDIVYNAPESVGAHGQQMAVNRDGEGVRIAGALGLKSTNSWSHAFGNCSVCMFENRYQHGQSASPCSKGSSCSFCHQAHDFLDIKRKRKSGALRRSSMHP